MNNQTQHTLTGSVRTLRAIENAKEMNEKQTVRLAAFKTAVRVEILVTESTEITFF